MTQKLRTVLRGRSGWALVVATALVGGLALLLLRAAPTSAADVPDRLVYRGLLTGQDGAPAPGGTYAVRLAFFDDPTAGTELCRWTETTVAVRNGRFQVEVGGASGSGTCSGVQAMLRGTSDIWVETAIQDTDGSFLALRPRLPVEATFRALHAEYAERAGDRLALQLVPSGMVAMFNRDCPVGWDRVPEMDGRIPRGAAVAGGFGGSETTAAAGDHTHALGSVGSHGHSTNHTGDHSHAFSFCGGQADYNWNLQCVRWIDGANPGACERVNVGNVQTAGGHSHGIAAAGEHAHSIATVGNHTHAARPPAASVVFCRKR
ncbi:MAG: hypothetical protein GYA57_00655 [Myxococcales bacterium]|nr:hypothetical protein [Myxococcales bacterium]